MAVRYANNASSTLGSAITSTSATSLTVASGTGSLFSSLNAGDVQFLTINDGVNMEIVEVTAISGDTFTIVRAQDGTTAHTFAAGTAVSQFVTRAMLDQLKLDALPSSTDVVPEGASNLYFSSSRVLAAILTGLSTATATAVAATDSVLVAIGKLQAQVSTKISGNQTITLSGDATGSGATGITVSLANSGATAGSYNNVTVDAKGRVTSGSNASYLTSNQTITVSGDATGSGSTSIALTLATISNSGTGAFNKIAVNGKGLVTGTVAVTQSDITALLGAGSITNAMLANSAVANLSGTNTGDETVTTIKSKLGISTLSGSNTGDQTITLTGDISGTGTGSFATTLANSGVIAGTYNNVTVDAKGRATAGTNVSYLTGNQTITASGDVTGSGATSLALTLANSGVTAGTYNNITVDAKGRATSGSNVSYLTGNQSITVSGDATGSGATSIALTLANSGVTAGTYRSITVDAKGRATGGTNPTTLSGYGITDAQAQISATGLLKGAGAGSISSASAEVDYVTPTGTGTLSGKTVTGLKETKAAPAISAGTLTLDCSTGNVFAVSLNANITTLTLSNVPSTGTAYALTLAFTADGTARTVTWGSAVKWPGGTAPTLTSTSTKVDTFVLTTWDGGTTWYAFVGGQNA